MLLHAPVNFTHVHMDWSEFYFDPEEYDIFIVATRNPVNRIISAFNWRHPIGGAPLFPHWTPVERMMYRCFPQLPGGVNMFAEALEENDTDCGWLARRCLHSEYARCGHLAKGFHWYLQTGLTRGSRSVLSAVRNSRGHKHIFPVRAEHFSTDSAALLDWLCVPPELRPAEPHTNSQYRRRGDTNLTSKGLHALEAHLKADDFALEDLARLADHV
jgi:hypothetical protein